MQRGTDRRSNCCSKRLPERLRITSKTTQNKQMLVSRLVFLQLESDEATSHSK